MKTSLILAAALTAGFAAQPALLAAVAPKAASKLDALFEDKAVAKGKNIEIKESELEAGFAEFLAAAAAQGRQVPDNLRAGVRYRIVEKLVAAKTTAARASDEDQKAATAKLDESVAGAVKMLGSADALEQRLKAAGQTLASFKSSTFQQNLIQIYLERVLTPLAPPVTDAQVREYYDKNPTRFERPETTKVKHILVTVIDRQTNTPFPEAKRKEKAALARRIQERAAKGEDFDALVKEFSDDDASTPRQGEVSFSRGQVAAASKAFETAAFTMKPGQISDLVETAYGYHILKLIEKTPAETVAFDKVSKEIRDGLTNVELQKLIPAHLAKLQKEDGVEILIPMPPELKAALEAEAKPPAAPAAAK